MTTTSVSDPCRQTLYSSRHFVNLGSPSNFLSMADLSLDGHIDEVRELTEQPNNNCFIWSQYHRALVRACPKWKWHLNERSSHLIGGRLWRRGMWFVAEPSWGGSSLSSLFPSTTILTPSSPSTIHHHHRHHHVYLGSAPVTQSSPPQRSSLPWLCLEQILIINVMMIMVKCVIFLKTLNHISGGWGLGDGSAWTNVTHCRRRILSIWPHQEWRLIAEMWNLWNTRLPSSISISISWAKWWNCIHLYKS